jgi:hypothetical protein
VTVIDTTDGSTFAATATYDALPPSIVTGAAGAPSVVEARVDVSGAIARPANTPAVAPTSEHVAATTATPPRRRRGRSGDVGGAGGRGGSGRSRTTVGESGDSSKVNGAA